MDCRAFLPLQLHHTSVETCVYCLLFLAPESSATLCVYYVEFFSLCETQEQLWGSESVTRASTDIVASGKRVKFQFWVDCLFKMPRKAPRREVMGVDTSQERNSQGCRSVCLAGLRACEIYNSRSLAVSAGIKIITKLLSARAKVLLLFFYSSFI